MIEIISGFLGSGKTASVVAHIVQSKPYKVYANFPLRGVKNTVLLSCKPEEWAEQGIYQGFRRDMAHPEIVVALDEMPEIVSQYDKPDSALLTYLRHSDKIGHHVYIIAQRVGHIPKTLRELAERIIFIFRIGGMRWYLRINKDGKKSALFPRPLSIKAAFGHYDTASIVSPHEVPSVLWLPRKGWLARVRCAKWRAVIFLFFLLDLAAVLW